MNRIKTLSLTSLLALCLSSVAPALSAGTLIEIVAKGEATTIVTDGKQARMNTSGSDYVLVDYAKQSVRMVDVNQRQVMLVNSNDMPKTGAAPSIKTSVRRLGSGPNIAGYSTEKYEYSADGRSCGIVYGSKDALRESGIKDLLNAMKTMMERQRAMMGGFAGMMDKCTLADMEMSKHVSTIGVPMRTEENGVVDSEIKRISLKVNLPADTFTVPAGYKTVSVKDKMQNAAKDMANMQKQMQQHQPQMQQMMQQLQQSGQMTPEAMEQMRRAQEMLKQYQQ